MEDSNLDLEKSVMYGTSLYAKSNFCVVIFLLGVKDRSFRTARYSASAQPTPHRRWINATQFFRCEAENQILRNEIVYIRYF